MEYEHLIGKNYKEVEEEMGKPSFYPHQKEEWVYIMQKYCMGMLKKQLHLYFRNEKVSDYYIGVSV